MFEDNVDPIFITDWDGRILEVNLRTAKLTGFTETSLLKMNIHHFHQMDWAAVGDDLSNLVEGKTISYQSPVHRRQGDSIPVEVNVRKVVIEGNDRLQWLVRDITKRKNLDKLRDDLVSMIYHDLRSPLANVVSGLALLTQMLPEDDPAIQSIVDIALRSTERVQNLASSLLDTTRMEAGQKVGAPIATEMHEVITSAVEAVAPFYRGRSQILKINLPQQLPKMLVDTDMIKRVTINLLENASKYSEENTEVEIGARPDERWLEIWVKDNGRGISAVDQETIFEKFTRARRGSSGSTKGLGLGLAFCKLAVEGHGGKIWVESEPNKGSKFTFTLPITQ